MLSRISNLISATVASNTTARYTKLPEQLADLGPIVEAEIEQP